MDDLGFIKVTENKVTENKVTENKVTENKVTENEVIETNLPAEELPMNISVVTPAVVDDKKDSEVVSVSSTIVSTETANAKLLKLIGVMQFSHHLTEEDTNNSVKPEQIFMTFSGLGHKETSTLNGGKLVTITKAVNAPGLEPLNESITYQPGAKLPIDILRSILSFFKAVYDLHKTESAAQVYLNKTTNKYFMYFPKQIVSGAHVDYSADDNAKYLYRQEHELVLELHSHADMGAFFSSGDNSNERFACMYAICGKFGGKTAAFIGRVKYMDLSAPLPLEQIFDLTGMTEAEALSLDNLPEVPKDIMDRVELRTYIAAATSYAYDYANYPGYGSYGTKYKNKAYTNYIAKKTKEAGSTTGSSITGNSITTPSTYAEKIYHPSSVDVMLDVEWLADSLTPAEKSKLLTILSEDAVVNVKTV